MTAELLLSSSGGTTAMTVNDTVAAHGFLRRLPFSGVWSPCDGELYCTAPRLVYDPSELGLGCACGDVTLSRGWLAQREEILAFCQAGPHDGGGGALLVLLRAQNAAQR